MEEPAEKRAAAFFDGQNLYHHAKAAFGHHFPNYDPVKLFEAVCARRSWKPAGVRFYTGKPDASKDPIWHGFWSNKLLALRRGGVLVYDRPLRYHPHDIILPNGSTHSVEIPQEKGIDVRLALDVMRLALEKQFDVAVIFSQDQDLSEVAQEIREISRSQNRWIKLACAFPLGPRATAKRGIDKTDWFRMDQAFYDACLDPTDYRPGRYGGGLPSPP